MKKNQDVEHIVENPKLFLAPSTIKNCFFTWLIPGLGYWRTGRKKACYLVAACLFSAFLLGIIQGGDLFPFSGEGKIRGIGAICQLGMGLPYLLAQLFVERGSPLNPTYDYGTNFFLVAGMLNYLSVMDVFDISVGRKPSRERAEVMKP